jgi:hypothetical protein
MKNKQILVRLDEAEKSAIERHAQNCNLSVSEFLRMVGQMNWIACPECSAAVRLKYISGFSGSATEPPEEGHYKGFCEYCLEFVFIPEGEYHGK